MVTSCDKYEDAWHPFFELLHIYANDFPYPIVLNTERKHYASPHFNIRVINTPQKTTWSQRLKNVLNQIETEFVLLIIDDYFLKAPFDKERFEKVLAYLRENIDVGVVDIAPRWASSEAEVQYNLSHNDIEDNFYVRERDEWNITLVPTVWRKQFLTDLLRAHEDVWTFEYYSGMRAKKTGMRVVRFVTHTPTIYEYDYQIWTGMGITRGQWLPKNADFFRQHGISVDFSGLGILNVSSVDEIKNLNRKSVRAIINGINRRIYRRITKKASLK